MKLFRVLSLLCLAALTGCSPGYVLRAAYEESSILWNRRKIEEVIADPSASTDEREKLKLVLEARSFSETIGLTPEDSFTRYTALDRDVLAWIVIGAKRDSFTLRQWWFPIVGSVPYKGFFDKEDAIAEAQELEAEGFETAVRGTEALSTLGWFNDPILSTTLKHDQYQISNTVLHEILHSTVWVPNHVDFNESLANFVGHQAAIDFYSERLKSCLTAGNDSCAQARTDLQQIREAKVIELTVGKAVMKLYAELDSLYRSPLSSEEKLAQRKEVFARHVGDLRKQYPRLRILTEVNNAELLQLKLYLTNLDLFDSLFTKHNYSWKEFLGTIQQIADAVDDDSELQPFELLKQKVTE